MKYKHDRLMKAKKSVALVSACSVSIDRVINTALSSIGGTVFDAKLKEVDGQVVWRVKLLTASGRVKMYIDARSGRVLEAMAEITVDKSRTMILPEIPIQGRHPNLESVSR